MTTAVVSQASVASVRPPVSAEFDVYLSHSSSTLMEKCGAAYAYRYRDRLDSVTSSVNLGFGLAFDQAVSAFVIADLYGLSVDVNAVFVNAYKEWAATRVVDFSTRWKGHDDILATGELLLSRFVDWWKASGYKVMLDLQGMPLVQRELRVRLPRNVIYTSILDLVVMTPDGEVVILDVKTPSQDSTELFALNSGQLTGQQLVLDAHKESLGIASIDKVGFLNAVKRPVPQKKDAEGPVVAPVHLVPARTPEQVEEYVQSRLWIADDIRRKRFAKRSLDSYCTPCTMCDYHLLCSKQIRDGLHVRPPRPRLTSNT